MFAREPLSPPPPRVEPRSAGNQIASSSIRCTRASRLTVLKSIAFGYRAAEEWRRRFEPTSGRDRYIVRATFRKSAMDQARRASAARNADRPRRASRQGSIRPIRRNLTRPVMLDAVRRHCEERENEGGPSPARTRQDQLYPLRASQRALAREKLLGERLFSTGIQLPHGDFAVPLRRAPPCRDKCLPDRKRVFSNPFVRRARPTSGDPAS